MNDVRLLKPNAIGDVIISWLFYKKLITVKEKQKGLKIHII
jgi:hypothetical protein